jgi:hypothetical protein
LFVTLLAEFDEYLAICISPAIQNGGSFLGVKRSGCGTDHPPPSIAEVEERVELYLFSLSLCLWVFVASDTVKFTMFSGSVFQSI